MTALSTPPIDRVLDALTVHELAYELTSDTNTIIAQCPLHEDPQRSLSFRESPSTGNILVHCFVCTAPAGDVAGAIGLRLEDLITR